MNMTTIFVTLLKHKMDLKRLQDDEECNKKKKTLALKIEEEKDCDSDEERC